MCPRSLGLTSTYLPSRAVELLGADVAEKVDLLYSLGRLSLNYTGTLDATKEIGITGTWTDGTLRCPTAASS